MVGTKQMGEVKNSMGNGEAKELICMTHGQELRWWNDGGRGGTEWRGIKREENRTTVIASSEKYILKNL